ncbi:MAG TPA: DUF4214 domain-containing protein [Gemmataceae bacterium]|nr:DUF4214 domain-containing protein [Gemmataceae bacterium]
MLSFTKRRLRAPFQGFKPVAEQLENRCLLSIDPILEWNGVALDVNRVAYSGAVTNDEFGPTRSSRALAIEHVAMFDAWNSIHPDYTPYLVQAPNAENASDVAAVAQAGHDTILAMYPHQQASIDTALTQTLRRVPDGAPKTLGIAVGQFVAQAILAARTNDGAQIPGQYISDGLPGHHEVDPLNPDQGFLTPAWGNVNTFGIRSTDAVPTRPVPDMNSLEYALAYDQTKRLGAETSTERTTDMTEIGIFWGYDVARGLGDPPRLLNQVARVIAVQQDNTIGQNARLFALINIAMADAGIDAWGIKYHNDFWRPIMAIRRGGEDGNADTVPDPNWQPLGAPLSNPLPTEHVNFTPPFPSYVSGHATFGGATFKTLADFYQTDDINFSIPFDFISDEFNGLTRDIHEVIPSLILDHVRQIRPRHYDSFSQAAAEISASRIFDGIHWRFDATEGVSAGDRIADIDFDTKLRPTDGGGSKHVATVDFAAQIDAYLNNTYLTLFGSGAAASGSALGGGIAGMNANQTFIDKVYHDMLHRNAEPGGLASWEAHLDQGMSRPQVVTAILATPEGLLNQVTDMYTKVLHRLPDPSGLQTFTTFLAQGGTPTQLEASLLGSQEYFVVHGADSTDGFLQALYADELNRMPDSAGAAGFSQQLGAGVPRITVTVAILTSPEGRADDVQLMYQRLLHRNPDPSGANAFDNALQTGMSDVIIEAAIVGSDEYKNQS